MLGGVAPLVAAGLAVHWLYARSKRPIGERWQDAPVPTLDDLTASWRDGNNVGVRLGEPSRVDGGYLHAFDVDVRDDSLVDEAWDALAELLPIDPDTLPSVVSGSGGASRHLYFISDKPFYSRKLLVSEGKHRRFDRAAGREVWSYDWEIELFGTGKQVALPPSIHPDTLKPYTWERPLDFDALDFGLSIAPIISAARLSEIATPSTDDYAFESVEPLTFRPGQLEAELDEIPDARIDDYHDWVSLGQALHHQFGGAQRGFDLWVQHSKRSDKFNGNGNERSMRLKWRGFGRSRRLPVTMATIRQWVLDARRERVLAEFDEVDGDDFLGADSRPQTRADADILDDFLGTSGTPSSHLTADNDDILGDPPAPTAAVDPIDDIGEAGNETRTLNWTSLLDLTEKGGFKSNLHNVELIVCNDPRLVGLIQLNEFTQETVQRKAPGTKANRRDSQPKPTRQLDGRVWQVSDRLNGDLWSDDRDFAIRSILEAPKTQGGYDIKLSDRDLKAAVVLAANRNAFHPVREYLSGLVWDGVPRVERLWIDYVNAHDDQYHRDVARLMMIAAVTRIFEPGHKFDFATILEGIQGKRKSTLISVLGRHWFAELDGDFHDSKQMIELMQGAWIMEIPELTGFGRADVRAIKAFISRQKDRARLAYARRAGSFPRQCIFVGSTNDREYLKDDTGGRRFWPVECRLRDDQEIDTDALEKSIDQMWAEAVALYQQMRADKPHGTLPLYLRDGASRVIAARLQESRRQESPDDILAGKISEWLEAPINDGGFEDDGTAEPRYRNETCSAQVWVECLHKDLAAFKFQEQGTVNRALAKIPGWEPAGSKRFPIYGKQRLLARGGVDGMIERSAYGDLL